MNPNISSKLNRRDFLRASTVAALTAPAALDSIAQSDSGGTLRIGLVGCGGRGTGAAAQALGADKNVKLVAMGDAFEDRLQSSLKTLKAQEIASKIDIQPENCFVGF